MARALHVCGDKVMSSCVQGLMREFAFDESPSAGKDFDRRNWGKGVSDGVNTTSRDLENAEAKPALPPGRMVWPALHSSPGWYMHPDSSSPHPPAAWFSVAAPQTHWFPKCLRRMHSFSQCCDWATWWFRCHFYHWHSHTIALSPGALDHSIMWLISNV